MKTNRPWAKLGLIIAAAVALSGSAILTACGKLKSENVPSSGEQSLTLDVVNATKGSDGRYSVRANGRDSIEIVATVKGLSSFVGFYIPRTWGTFTGGILSETDGFYYYPADRSGVARATLVAGTTTGTTVVSTATNTVSNINPTGRIELVARSLDVEKILPLSFDFATLMILPPTLVIYDTFHYSLDTRGGMPPIQWNVSQPGVLGFTPYGSGVDVYPLIDPNDFSLAPIVIVTAVDAEGQMATATVTLTPMTTVAACTASTLNADPAAPLAGTAATISVTVVDFSKKGSASVSVAVGGVGSGSIILTPWGTPGVFQVSYLIAAPVLGQVYTFTYAGTNATCMPSLLVKTVTPA